MCETPTVSEWLKCDEEKRDTQTRIQPQRIYCERLGLAKFFLSLNGQGIARFRKSWSLDS